MKISSKKEILLNLETDYNDWHKQKLNSITINLFMTKNLHTQMRKWARVFIVLHRTIWIVSCAFSNPSWALRLIPRIYQWSTALGLDLLMTLILRMYNDGPRMCFYIILTHSLIFLEPNDEVMIGLLFWFDWW